uniref:Uncharacterized protein n=1 Tax=Glossina palpalis gambiensis TaxID=67801 RepID=A0A1B0B4J4_9MUSC
MFKFVIVCALIACAAAVHEELHHDEHHYDNHHSNSDDVHAELKSYHSDVHHKGFEYAFETSNHIRAAAHGDEHGNVQGDFEWVDPHGEHIAVKYGADEHGYHPESHVLPTPHPIPDYILRSIEYINAHPYHEPEHHEHHQAHHEQAHHHQQHHEPVHHHEPVYHQDSHSHYGQKKI